jgi:hypothetical protein
MLAGLAGVPSPLLAQLTKPCSFGASGEGCIFDVVAQADGTLIVDTRAGTAGDRWRATVVTQNKGGGKSNVGTGSNTVFTGSASFGVKTGKAYEVIVTYETPLPGAFPAGVTVRFNGPVTVSEPRPVSGFPVEGQSCTQLAEADAAIAAVDVENIGCGALMMCRTDPGGDTDAFKFSAPAGGAVSIKIAGVFAHLWELFDPNGRFVASSFGQFESGPLPFDGDYTIEVSNTSNNVGDYVLSMQGISQTYLCGTGMTFGDLKAGRHDAPGDIDAFQFFALEGQVASIKITGVFASLWELFDPSGRFVASSFGQFESGPLPATGTYTIKASNTSNNIGFYTISLQLVSGS